MMGVLSDLITSMLSPDHDHVLSDLSQRFDAVLEALEADPEFVLNRVAHGKIILGELGGIETGIRQLTRHCRAGGSGRGHGQG